MLSVLLAVVVDVRCCDLLLYVVAFWCWCGGHVFIMVIKVCPCCMLFLFCLRLAVVRFCLLLLVVVGCCLLSFGC